MEQGQELSVIFVLGRPGSGKGSQCSLISDKFGFIHLSAGELLRNERDNCKSAFKARLDTHFEEGTTVDPEITVCLLLRNILKFQNQTISTPTSCTQAVDGSKTKMYFLVDGFPPNLHNFEVWSEKLKTLSIDISVPFIIYFDATEDVCMTRCLQRGRINSGKSSDTALNVHKRFVKFTQETSGIIDWFNKLNKVKRFDANDSKEIVFGQICALLKAI